MKPPLVYCRWSADANGGKLEALGYKDGYRVDVDIPDGTWSNAAGFHDVLIFNTGHWYYFLTFSDNFVVSQGNWHSILNFTRC